MRDNAVCAAAWNDATNVTDKAAFGIVVVGARQRRGKAEMYEQIGYANSLPPDCVLSGLAIPMIGIVLVAGMIYAGWQMSNSVAMAVMLGVISALFMALVGILPVVPTFIFALVAAVWAAIVISAGRYCECATYVADDEQEGKDNG